MDHTAELQDRLKKLVLDNRTNKEAAVVKLLTLAVQHKLVYGYVRVSLQKQVDEGHSLEAQSQKIKDYCAQHNLPDPIIMADEGISGKSTETRDSFNQMVSVAKSGDTIISYSLSRLGRGTLDILNLVKTLKDKGVSLLCLDKQIDLTTMEGNLFLTILAGVNEFEREQASARTSMVMQEMKRAGKLRTKGPFGYRAQDNEFVPVPEEQKVIEYITLFLSMNPTATNASVTRAVQSKVDAGELFMRRSRSCDGKRAHQSTISNIIKNNHLRDIIKEDT